MIFDKAREVVYKNPSIFKEYLVPVGSILIPAITLWSQSAPPLWVSLVIGVYFAIASIFVVLPSIVIVSKRFIIFLQRKRLEKIYLPKISASLCRFKSMMESNRSETVWYVWNRVPMTLEIRAFISPNQSNYHALVAWLNCLNQTVDSGKSLDFQLISSEISTWVQQYVCFCREAYMQFDNLLRSDDLEDLNAREIKKDWNHARDEHNQAIISWKTLCTEINSSFRHAICSEYFETLKPLE